MKNKLYLLSLFLLQSITQITFAASGVPAFDHIVMVIEENHSLHDCLGNPDMPYFNFLANNGALFTRSYAWGHPSQPNYIVLFSGSNYGITDNEVHPKINAPNLWSILNAANKSYKSFCQGLPAVGSDVADSGSYARRHNPTPQFVGVPAQANQPFTAFPQQFSQLPQVSFIVPDVDNDAHDGSLAQADTWLKNNIGAYADWAKNNNSLLIVTFDEQDGSEEEIFTVFYGANVKPGVYTEKITHYSILRLMEDAFGTNYIGNSVTAASITDCWLTTPPPPPPNPDFSLTAVSAVRGDVNVSFVTKNWASKSVSLNYSINGGTVQKVAMSNNTNNWTYRIANVPNQAVVRYSVSYEWNGQTLQTSEQSLTYVNPSPTDPFKQSILMTDPTTAQVTFIPEFPAQFVDIHYTIDNGSQLNVRMQNNNNSWTLALTRLQNDDKIHYSFTYEQNGTAYNSDWFDFTVTSTVTPPPPPAFKYVQSIQPIDSQDTTQINFVTVDPIESAVVSYVINGGTHIVTPLKSLGGNVWVGTLPELQCGDQVQYTFTYIRNKITTTIPTITYTR